MSQLQFSYHNTTNLSGADLVAEEQNAQTQEGRILKLFQWADETMMSPSDVMRKYDQVFNPVPLTSIRRALTNLTKAGKLEMTGFMKAGLYNKPEHCWRLLRE